MPKEVKDVDEFLKIAEKAKRVWVKKGKDWVKFKARGGRYLYTLKLSGENLKKAEEIAKKLKLEIK